MPVQEDSVEVAVDGRRSDPAYDERVRGEVHRLRALLSDVTKWRQDWGRSE